MVAKTMTWQFDFGVWLASYRLYIYILKYMQTMSEAPNESWFTLCEHDSVGCMEGLKPGDSGFSLGKN